MNPKVAIIGYGFVGKAMASIFPNALCYDIQPGFSVSKAEVNKCDVAFVCVPTPCREDGSCDTSAVEETITWLKTPLIVIRSTVLPGTTAALSKKYKKNILFSPEFIGETSFHPYKDERHTNFIILGGPRDEAAKVAQIYAPICGPACRFYFTDTTTAELAKYMTNCFLATKVIFCHQFFKIAEALNVNYETLREIWLADPRVSRDHTMIFRNNQGFGGKCLPKDLSAIIKFAETLPCNTSLLKKVAEINRNIRHKIEILELSRSNVQDEKNFSSIFTTIDNER